MNNALRYNLHISNSLDMPILMGLSIFWRPQTTKGFQKYHLLGLNESEITQQMNKARESF